MKTISHETQLTLFEQSRQPVYPFAIAEGKTDTSRDAAKAIRHKGRLTHIQILEVLRGGNYTADEIAKILGLDRFYCRPRLTELLRAGKIVDTNLRRKNSSGQKAIVWAKRAMSLEITESGVKPPNSFVGCNNQITKSTVSAIKHGRLWGHLTLSHLNRSGYRWRF